MQSMSIFDASFMYILGLVYILVLKTSSDKIIYCLCRCSAFLYVERNQGRKWLPKIEGASSNVAHYHSPAASSVPQNLEGQLNYLIRPRL